MRQIMTVSVHSMTSMCKNKADNVFVHPEMILQHLLTSGLREPETQSSLRYTVDIAEKSTFCSVEGLKCGRSPFLPTLAGPGTTRLDQRAGGAAAGADVSTLTVIAPVRISSRCPHLDRKPMEADVPFHILLAPGYTGLHNILNQSSFTFLLMSYVSSYSRLRISLKIFSASVE